MLVCMILIGLFLAEVRRLHNLAMGPLQTEFQQAIYGVSSIRAYCAEDMFSNKMTEKLTTQSTCLLLMHGLNSWLTLRLDILGATISFFIYIIAFGFRDLISSGNFVVAVFLSSSIPAVLSMLVYISSELEASFTSLEKIQHDIDSIEQEESAEMRGGWEDGDDDWPQSGEIAIEGLTMGYRDLPSVLHSVSVTIKDKEKIGICGRTGSGCVYVLIICRG
jgi:ATP-binding cassette, subfamily C (CFTR/MRP), member 5